MNFEFATSQQIIFGSGRLGDLPKLARPFGTRPAFITGSSAERITPVFQLLKCAGIHPAAFSIADEPTIPRIAELAQKACALECDYVIALGGGSVIDAGKAIAALLTNTGSLMDYLEVIGKGRPLTQASAPCIAIPTTSGTGAEVTRNAVLRSPERHVKVSMRHPSMLPDIALIDPELTLSMPPNVTASTGLDALTQLIEAFVSINSSPLTDALCRDAIPRAARALPCVYEKGNDLAAREEMAYASLCGGLALANAGLGAVHGFAGAIGGMFSAPHGTVCAALLPAVFAANNLALQTRAPAHPACAKYAELNVLLTGQTEGNITHTMGWLKEICAKLATPGLADLGVTADHFPEIIANAKQASSMKGNPILLTDEELAGILEASLAPA